MASLAGIIAAGGAARIGREQAELAADREIKLGDQAIRRRAVKVQEGQLDVNRAAQKRRKVEFDTKEEKEVLATIKNNADAVFNTLTEVGQKSDIPFEKSAPEQLAQLDNILKSVDSIAGSRAAALGNAIRARKIALLGAPKIAGDLAAERGKFVGKGKLGAVKAITGKDPSEEDLQAIAGLPGPPTPTQITKLQSERDALLKLGDPKSKRKAAEIQKNIDRLITIVGRTPSDIEPANAKQLGELEDQEIFTRNFLDAASKFQQLVLKAGPAGLGTPGAFAAISRDAIATFQGFAQIIKADVTRFEDGTQIGDSIGQFDENGNPLDEAARKAETIWQRLGIAGRLNAQIKSDIVNLAFAAAAASGQTGRAVSDRDYTNFVKQIGANVGDPEVLVAVVDRVKTRIAGNFRNTWLVRQKSGRFPSLVGKQPPDLLGRVQKFAAPSQAAIDHLKADPNRSSEFDRKYGAGAAAKALGQ